MRVKNEGQNEGKKWGSNMRVKNEGQKWGTKICLIKGITPIYMGKNFVSDGTICTTFCPTQPNNKISTHVTHCNNVRYILGLFYFKFLVVQCKINFWAIAW